MNELTETQKQILEKLKSITWHKTIVVLPRKIGKTTAERMLIAPRKTEPYGA